MQNDHAIEYGRPVARSFAIQFRPTQIVATCYCCRSFISMALKCVLRSTSYIYALSQYITLFYFHFYYEECLTSKVQ